MQGMLERLETLETQVATLSEVVGGIVDVQLHEIGRKVDQAAAKSGTIEAEGFVLRRSARAYSPD